MPRYKFTLTNQEKEQLEKLIQKGGKGYRIKHAQILLKLNHTPENEQWTYKRIQTAYNATNSTISGVAKRFTLEGIEAALGRKKQLNYHRKVTGEIEAHICTIACSNPPKGRSRWTMQTIADQLIRLQVVDYITDTTVCEVMKKTKLNPGKLKNGASPKQTPTM
jgi:transposase